MEELTNEVLTTWNRSFRPCEYVWLYQSCMIEKIKCPDYKDMSEDEIKSMDEYPLSTGHHFESRTAYPVIKMLMEKEGYSLNDIRLGSTRTRFDIYAGRFDRNSQVIPVEIGTVTNIEKLIESRKDKVKSVWLYNYGDFIYIFKLKSKAKNFYEFILKNGNKEILKCLHKPFIGLAKCLSDFDFDNCVFVKELNNEIPCNFDEAYFKSKILKQLSFYYSSIYGDTRAKIEQ